MAPKNLGFTLLEILVALLIFSIVALIMTQALHLILTTQSTTEEAAERLSQTQMALLLFSRDLEQALDRSVSNQDGQPEGAFLGSRTALTFTHSGFANPKGDLQSSSMQRSRYRFEKSQIQRDLWEELDQAPHALPHSRLLLSKVKELSFRYLDNKNIFHPLWPVESENTTAKSAGSNLSSGKLPRAVELSLTFIHGGRLQQIYLLPQQEVPYESR